MKRSILRFVAVMTALVMAATVTACSSGKQSQGGAEPNTQTAPKKTVEITYWHEDASPEKTPVMQEIIKWFNDKEAQTGIKIKYEGFPSSNAYEKFSVAIAGGSTPDISGVWDSWITDFILQGALLKIDDRFEKWDDKAQFDPKAIKAFRKKDVAAQELYGLPFISSNNGSVLWYRADRFKQYGVNPPETWDDFFNLLPKINFPDKKEYAFAMRGGKGSAKQMLVMLYSYSGAESFFNDEGTAFLRDPALVPFLEKYASIFNKYTSESDLTSSNKEMIAAFGGGFANMYQHNLGSLIDNTSKFKDGQFMTAALPKSPKGYRTMESGSVNGFVVYKNTKNPNEAWEVMKHLTSKDSTAKWQKLVGELPPRLDVQQMDQVKNAPHIKSLLAAMNDPTTKFIDNPTFLPEYKTIESQILEPGFQSVLTGKKAAKDYLNEAAKELEASYKNFTQKFGKPKK